MKTNKRNLHRLSGLSLMFCLLTGTTAGVAARNSGDTQVSQEILTEETVIALEQDSTSADEGAANIYNPVKIALVLSDINSDKDLEFARGVLSGLEQFENSPYKISLKMINGKISVDSLYSELDAFAPTLIVANHERNFPIQLAQYSDDKGVKTVNAFDMRNEYYVNHPNMIQLLTPSSYFNDEIGRYIAKNYEGNEVIVIGEADNNDQIYDNIIKKMQAQPVKFANIDELAAFAPEPNKNYLIYCTYTNKNDIVPALAQIEKIRSVNPFSFITVVGRPSWITLPELAKNLAAANAFIPSRCYFDPTTDKGKNYIKYYNTLYGHTPIKTFPVYSVMGYDMVKYFVDGINESGNDFNAEWPKSESLQTDFRLQRAPGYLGGYYNPDVYMIKFRPDGSAEKILID